MRTRVIYVGSGDDNCPADALMADFRKALSENKYAKNIEFSERCIQFFREHADIVEEEKTDICFMWYAVPEEELPPLKVKIAIRNSKYLLSYLIEYGEEQTKIQAKTRKGLNQKGGKRILIVKEEKDTKENQKESDEKISE